MKFIENKIPEWIKPYVELGPGVSMDVKINDQNFIWYLQAMCCPPNYEKYLVILHPFWINKKVEQLNEKGVFPKESDINDNEFERINYSDFFNRYGEKFELETAIEIKEKIAKEHLRGKNKWPDYLWYPGEGESELTELKIVGSNLIKMYGDVESDFYYVLLKTNETDDNKVLRGKISELDMLVKFEPEIRDNPSGIYPTSGSEWCIITDYDCPMTFVCGSSELIDNILKDKTSDLDIYEIKPKYKAKKPAHNTI